MLPNAKDHNSLAGYLIIFHRILSHNLQYVIRPTGRSSLFGDLPALQIMKCLTSGLGRGDLVSCLWLDPAQGGN